jgi:hypothetical protein
MMTRQQTPITIGFIGLVAEHRIQDYRLDAEYGSILGG